MEVIKKYSNRKLYSTEDSMYLDLKDIRERVVDGTDFIVIDNITKNDVTAEVLKSSLLGLDVSVRDLVSLIRNTDVPSK